MSELAAPLRDVLERTGYLNGGAPAAPSVLLSGRGNHVLLPSFQPDALWRSSTGPTTWPGSTDLKVYFKFVKEPDDDAAAEWQREVWNEGFCPLMWVVSPKRIELYSGFGRPQDPGDAKRNLLDTFQFVDRDLARLDQFAGRLTMETGQFWQHVRGLSRKTSVDRQLLHDLNVLERKLVASGLGRDDAQALIGRCIFTQYLVDREIVDERRLRQICDQADFPSVLADRAATIRLFEWLSDTFNGDMFPRSSACVPSETYLIRVRDFLTGTNLETGQTTFFPYRFDVIPVELISAIYEQFVHSAASDSTSEKRVNHARSSGVFYTPLTAVSLVLNEVFDGLTGDETMLDLTCGSGVFLVESFRRLVHLKSGSSVPTRQTVRDVLYQQVFGVDISAAAVRIAAFSLYLAALELDPDPRLIDGLGFDSLVDKVLLARNAFDVDFGDRRFDVIVGNPPWSYRGREGTAARRARDPAMPRPPRGESLDFVRRAMGLAHETTRFGMILSATPFFSRSATGVEAARSVVEALAPVTLVNLSDLSGWLFPNANMPAIALLARVRDQHPHGMTLVHARWSPAGESSHIIEIAPSGVTTLPIASWKRNAALFKAAFVGQRHDLLLLDDLWEKLEPLETRLRALGTSVKAGLKLGNRSGEAIFFGGVSFAGARAISHFKVDDVRIVHLIRAERIRRFAIYRAPLVLVKEFMLQGRPRPVVAVVERDTVYTDAYLGVSFADHQPDAAFLLAGILGSALATWYFLMSGSTFGIWMQRVQGADIKALPTPDLEQSVGSEVGKRVVEIVRGFRDRALDGDDWDLLDDAVFDLYGLDDEDRIVVRDGLFQASWQWHEGKLKSVEPADEADLRDYARAFLATMDAWLSASNGRRMRAEIYRVPDNAPLRVMRFVLEEAPGPSRDVKEVTPDGALSDVLKSIGKRTSVRITEELIGIRDLRVHAADEVSIIKPSARRNWLRVRALEDADQVVQDSVHGVNTA